MGSATAADPADEDRPGRTGRRPGSPDTRQKILDAARDTFTELGFAGASIRKIAAAAGVDGALIHHYFGSKDKLFLASIAVPEELPQLIGRVGAGPVDGLGVRLVSTMVGVWESPAGAGLVLALRSAITDPAQTRLLREFVLPRMIGPLIKPLHLPPEEAQIRIALLMSQILGLFTGRFLLAVEPLASLPVDQLAANVGATIQRYLTAPLAQIQ